MWLLTTPRTELRGSRSYQSTWCTGLTAGHLNKWPKGTKIGPPRPAVTDAHICCPQAQGCTCLACSHYHQYPKSSLLCVSVPRKSLTIASANLVQTKSLNNSQVLVMLITVNSETEMLNPQSIKIKMYYPINTIYTHIGKSIVKNDIKEIQ